MNRHSGFSDLSFQPLQFADLPALRDWLCRPHVAQWWGAAPSRAEVEIDQAPMIEAGSTTRGFIALLGSRPIGFIQSYVVMGSGGGCWEDDRDPGARGIDQFLAHPQDLGQGLGCRAS